MISAAPESPVPAVIQPQFFTQFDCSTSEDSVYGPGHGCAPRFDRTFSESVCILWERSDQVPKRPSREGLRKSKGADLGRSMRSPVGMPRPLRPVDDRLIYHVINRAGVFFDDGDYIGFLKAIGVLKQR